MYELPKDTKRALIIQGGGAIGPYATGVYAALYYWIKKDITEGKNIFDIVAGASAGAINSSKLLHLLFSSCIMRDSEFINYKIFYDRNSFLK